MAMAQIRHWGAYKKNNVRIVSCGKQTHEPPLEDGLYGDSHCWIYQ
jgi:hypothetical protein